MVKKIETKVADTILEKGVEIKVGGVKYTVAPPTTATLILVSELVARLPDINPATTAQEIVNETLRVAKDCRVVAEIPAVIILGAKNLVEKRKKAKNRYWGVIKEEETIIDKKKELADLLLQNYSPSELNRLTTSLLLTLEIGDFFGFTTSLKGLNLLKPTKKEVETIVSGR